jgi:hypothetical protein
MFDYRKSNRSQPNGSRQPEKSKGPPSMAAVTSATSSHSQASGLAYIRALKANLQRSASQILTPPGSSEAPAGPSGSNSESPFVDDIVNPQTQARRTDAQAGHQAEATMADEKDKIAVADELQRYIEEGVLDEVEYTKDFSLTRYWQVRDCLYTHYLKSLKHINISY